MDATGPQGLSEAEKAIWNAISDSEEGKGGDEKAGKSEQSGKSKKRPYAGMERVGVGVGVSKRCKGGKNRSGKWGGGEREGEISRVIKTLIKEGCAISDRIEFCLDENEGGIFAREDINQGTLLVRIPEHLSIAPEYNYRPERVIKSKVLSFLKQAKELSQFEKTLVHLLHVINTPESPFHSLFLKLLPKSFNTPMNWTKDQKDLVKGTELESSILNDATDEVFKSRVKPKLDEASQALGWKKDVDFELFQWAASVICTRGYHNGSNGPYLLPLIDQFNHSSTVNHTKLNVCNGVFFHIANIDIKKGEQIYTSYGDFSNSQLLHTYGFVEEDNPLKYVSLQAHEIYKSVTKILCASDDQIPEAEEDIKKRIQMAVECKWISDTKRYVFSSKDLTVIPEELLLAISLCFIDDE
ncbi:hypothetical protein AAMO2058_000616100 [Amorphochlora amoebiformis]